MSKETPLPKYVDFESTGKVKDYQALLKSALVEYFNTCCNDQVDLLTMDDVFVVWFSKTLQNWKGMVCTTREDGRYYELTFNGDKRELYIDTYKKVGNVVWYIAPIS